MASGAVQVWPGMPAAEPIIAGGRVAGIRLADQGVDKKGAPGPQYMPGMDVHAALTVVADGPVGPVGRLIDGAMGTPPGHHRREWAVGAKLVVDLPEGHGLKTGSVIHTFGYPEPEIFGFLYVHPGNIASLGVFIPSTWGNPVRTSYRYLQHWMTHPYLWRYLKGGVMRSWGAKTLQESGRRGEPFLAGEGYARIGEGSGSTNVLTGSGVDEAWATGVQLASAVLELLREKKPFTKENLDRAYVMRRRASRMDAESRRAARARDGFGLGFIAGMAGMGLAGFSFGLLSIPGPSKPAHRRIRALKEWFRGRIPPAEVDALLKACREKGVSLHDAFMDRAGWPKIEYDGKLLVSQQDALLMGGKVQAPDGFADHVFFLNPDKCRACVSKVCIEMCSGEAITPGEGGVPAFDREKCVHCGVCLWNCAAPRDGDPEAANTDFRAGAGGLHSGEN
jgi:electron-transferring-flavoprotein dehydrogenase